MNSALNGVADNNIQAIINYPLHFILGLRILTIATKN